MTPSIPSIDQSHLSRLRGRGIVAFDTLIPAALGGFPGNNITSESIENALQYYSNHENTHIIMHPHYIGMPCYVYLTEDIEDTIVTTARGQILYFYSSQLIEQAVSYYHGMINWNTVSEVIYEGTMTPMCYFGMQFRLPLIYDLHPANEIKGVVYKSTVSELVIHDSKVVRNSTEYKNFTKSYHQYSQDHIQRTYPLLHKSYSKLAVRKLPYQDLEHIDPELKAINDFVHRVFYNGNLDFMATRMIRTTTRTGNVGSYKRTRLSGTDMIVNVPKKLHLSCLTIRNDGNNAYSAAVNYLNNVSGLHQYAQGIVIRPVINPATSGLCPAKKVRTDTLLKALTNPLHDTNAVRTVFARQTQMVERNMIHWSQLAPEALQCIPITDRKYSDYITKIDSFYNGYLHVLPHVLI